MEIISKKFKETTRTHLMAAVVGATAMLGIVITVVASGSGQPNSYYATLQKQAGLAAEGKVVNMSGLDPNTLARGATAALVNSTIRQSIGSAKDTSMRAYAETACLALVASGWALGNVVGTDLNGGVNPNQTATASPSPTPTNPGLDYQNAYNVCLPDLVSWAVNHPVTIPTGVPPGPIAVPTG